MTTAIMNFTFAPLAGAFSGFHSFFYSLVKHVQLPNYIEWVTQKKLKN